MYLSRVLLSGKQLHNHYKDHWGYVPINCLIALAGNLTNAMNIIMPNRIKRK